MRFFILRVVSVITLSILATSCAENLPEVITLAPGASDVEIISDLPNKEIYAPAGEVHARVAGVEVSAAVREAKNELRNQAAAKGATFVSIDEVTSRASWDLRGKTIVTMTGTAFKAR